MNTNEEGKEACLKENSRSSAGLLLLPQLSARENRSHSCELVFIRGWRFALYCFHCGPNTLRRETRAEELPLVGGDRHRDIQTTQRQCIRLNWSPGLKIGRCFHDDAAGRTIQPHV